VSAVEQCRLELDAAAHGLSSVTALRAVRACTDALATYESNRAILSYERTRTEREAKARAERAAAEAKRAASFVERARRVEKTK